MARSARWHSVTTDSSAAQCGRLRPRRKWNTYKAQSPRGRHRRCRRDNGWSERVRKELASAGTEWLSQRFGTSARTALQTAEANGASFQRELEEHVRRLEDSRQLTPERAGAAFERPETLTALRAGYNAAAETSDPVKREVLAGLVADRLKAQAESIEAVTSRRAVELAASVSSRQLRTLAQLLIVKGIRPDESRAVRRWVQSRLAAMGALSHSLADLMYLESLSLLKYDEPFGKDLVEFCGAG